MENTELNPAAVTVASAPTNVVNSAITPVSAEPGVVVTPVGAVTAGVTPPSGMAEPTEAEKRIRQLVAQRKEAEERERKKEMDAAYWKGVAESRSTVLPGNTVITPPDLANAAPVAPDQDKFETYEEYEEAKDKYLVARAKWEIKQESAKEEAKRKEEEKSNRQKSEIQRIRGNWESKKAEAQVKYPDFHITISDPNFVQTGVTALLIQDSDVAGDLAYYLAKNPAEMTRLNSLPPHQAAKQVGVIEMKLRSVSHPAPQNIISQAPNPITPVQPAGGVQDVDEQDLPIEEFVRRRNQKQGLIKA